MKVVIAIDSSSASALVLEEAASHPWPEGTLFSVIHVVDLQRFGKLQGLLPQARQEAERIVDAGVQTLSRSKHEVISQVITGFPRRAVSEYAKEWHADLILVGSHGHSTIGRFLLGSVAQGILRTAPCSVEIVRAKKGAPGPRRPMKILLATDGSDCSVGATHAVANRLWPAGTVVRILSVEELVAFENEMAASSLSSIYPASLLEQLAKEAHERASSAVQMAKDILVRAGMNAVEDHSTPLGEPRGVILDTARDWGADLIVMGSHGRRGLDRLLLGSVSESVAIHANCSVEVVRR